jgi:hypothetical protein
MQTMTVNLAWKRPGVKHVGVAIFRENGEFVFGPNTFQDGIAAINENEISYDVRLNLNDGGYFLKAALMGETDNAMIAFVEEGPHFEVSKVYDKPKWGGVTKLDHTWKTKTAIEETK